MDNATTDIKKATEYLHTVETAIVERMAKATGYQPFQMKSMIKRIPALNEYYKKVRAQVLAEMAV